MKTCLKHLSLMNYRQFRSLEIDLDERLTVIVARNGGGKTALVEAIATAFEPFVTHMADSPFYGLPKEDVRRARAADASMEAVLPAKIAAAGAVLGKEREWAVSRTSIGKGSRGWQPNETAELALSAEILKNTLMEFTDSKHDKPPELPVLCAYGTSRLWVEDTPRRGAEPVGELTSRRRGYDECLSPLANFPAFAQWFKRMSEEENASRHKKTPSPHQPAARLEAVQSALSVVLAPTGWQGIAWDFVEKVVVAEHPIHGRLPVAMLSDGIKIVLAVVADIAHRCVRLNPQFGVDAPRKTSGVVMIDEVDMHLHPGWQQQIVALLLTAFPKVQFVLTTHSPQVLSTVNAENIRVIELVDGNGVVHTPGQQTRGVESADVLSTVMGVDAVPDVPESKDLHRYRAMIQDGRAESAEALALRATLEAHFGPKHPVIFDCDRLIRFQALKIRRPAASPAGGA